MRSRVNTRSRVENLAYRRRDKIDRKLGDSLCGGGDRSRVWRRVRSDSFLARETRSSKLQSIDTRPCDGVYSHPVSPFSLATLLSLVNSRHPSAIPLSWDVQKYLCTHRKVALVANVKELQSLSRSIVRLQEGVRSTIRILGPRATVSRHNATVLIRIISSGWFSSCWAL